MNNVIRPESNEADGQTKISSIRYAAPTHYTFKIQSYSLFSQHSIEKYETSVFESGGYKWKLVFYPNEYIRSKKKHHISLYLKVAETDGLTAGWEINAAVGLFLYDQIRETYLTLEDGGRFRRFHALRTKWGYSKLIPVATFKDPCNGYLVDDTCIFGAEVFVCKSTGEGECFSMIEDVTPYKYTWKIERFSFIKEKEIYKFNAGDWECKIELFPKGFGEENNKFISLYLTFEDLCKRNRVYAKCKLRIKDQLHGIDEEMEGVGWFDEDRWGKDEFLELECLNDPTEGFLVNDSLIIEAELSILGSSRSTSTT